MSLQEKSLISILDNLSPEMELVLIKWLEKKLLDKSKNLYYYIKKNYFKDKEQLYEKPKISTYKNKLCSKFEFNFSGVMIWRSI